MTFLRKIIFHKMPNTRSKTLVSDFSEKFSFSKKNRLTHTLPENIEVVDIAQKECKKISNKRNTVAKRKKVTIQSESGELSDNLELKKDKWMPNNWELVLDNIREMRKLINAPVDTIGCDELNLTPEVRRYQVLVSLMLSSQTKDVVNLAAMTRLREHGLTIENILETDEETLGKLIYPVAFWKTKAKHIKKATQMLKDEYSGDIPDTVEKLCKLPGVGPKMAHLAMNVGWGIVTGIGVDTHVHRISNRLGWVKKETKTPEATRQALESWLPKDLWSEVNHLLVGFGQTKCRPINPHCSSCLNKDICPASSAKQNKKSSPKK